MFFELCSMLLSESGLYHFTTAFGGLRSNDCPLLVYIDLYPRFHDCGKTGSIQI
jgi:hypothetical protein